MVCFFHLYFRVYLIIPNNSERRKIVRKITQLEKKHGLNLETLSVKDLNESTELQESNDLIDAKNKLRELKLNLLYIRVFCNILNFVQN